ncbi:hypothetical protein XENOCAPTIV_005756, partial [Xenoophorus captivus]
GFSFFLLCVPHGREKEVEGEEREKNVIRRGVTPSILSGHGPRSRSVARFFQPFSFNGTNLICEYSVL